MRPSLIPWLAADVREIVVETPRVKTLRLGVPGWPGHAPGQHVDVRLTAEDGYQAQRSYSIASPAEEDGLALTVERLEDGEVSTFLTDELRAGDRLELRGPLGGYFTWTVEHGGPLALIAGGSGIVPLMAMIRHRAAQASPIATALLCSWRTAEDVIYRGELARLAARRDGLEVSHTLGGDMGALRTELDRLDGNAAAGILREVFAVEMTTSSCTCAACRQSSPVSALLLYGGATGAVLRCPRCEALVLCITRVRSGHVIELQGIVHVGVADGDSPA